MATEVLIDQSTFNRQTTWNGAAAWQGQLFSPTVGEIWRLTEISGWGGGNTWAAKEGYCGVGICKSFTDWNPNNGMLFGECSAAGLSSAAAPKHTFDMTHSTFGYTSGLLLDSDHLYFLYFRLGAASAGSQMHSSNTVYDRHANTEDGMDSANSGGTWTKPAGWLIGGAGDTTMRFQLVGEKVDTSGGGGASHLLGNWSI
jgi:hypothetical protein